MPTTTLRTYAGRHHTLSRKRPSCEDATVSIPSKRPRLLAGAKPPVKPRDKHNGTQQHLVQLHLYTDKPTLRTCSICSLSYTKGAPDDEILHTAHCNRVQKGLEWRREEEKECMKAGVVEIVTGLKLKNGTKGRIICFRADVNGRIGHKITTLLETINLTLSAPPLTADTIRKSKMYLFLVPHQTKMGTWREKIVGCAIAEHIETAMAMVLARNSTPKSSSSEISVDVGNEGGALVVVDTGMGIFCRPEPLPTPMGIPRLFVASTHRRQGVASKLLTAAAKTFIHGYELDPRRGEVAFTQPTGDGKAVMLKWGSGGVRIYEE